VQLRSRQYLVLVGFRHTQVAPATMPLIFRDHPVRGVEGGADARPPTEPERWAEARIPLDDVLALA